MRLKIHPPSATEELVEFLERRACAVVQAGRGLLDVELADDLGAKRSRLELDLYLSVFHSMHPGVAVDVADQSARAAATRSSKSGTSPLS
jgi:hypothetical protein